MINFNATAKFNKDATLVLVDSDQLKRKKFNFHHSELEGAVASLAKNEHFAAKDGEIYPVQLKKAFVVLVGVGNPSESSLTALRIAIRRAFLSAHLKNLKSVEVVLSQVSDPAVVAVIEGVLIGTYAWRKYITRGKDEKAVFEKDVTIVASKKSIYDDAVEICAGIKTTRDLINENADVTDSVFIENKIRDLIRGKTNITIEVLNRKEMKAKGLGLHLAVNQGSNKEPKLIIVKYRGASSGDKYTAIIGKGMTYDTGGLNIKPTGSMETMRCDMSGAGAVVGILQNTIQLRLKKNVLFVVGLAENAIGPAAYKPGDVFRGYSGKTVEIMNTDAEGRLVLADAIAYVVKNYKPARLIDIATLTGAVVVALGHDYTGLVTTDDELSRKLVRISNDTDDRVWRLPNYPEIKDAVKSKIADIRNTGWGRGAGGTITAAEFLRQFTDGTPWAHLDIAGTAFVDGDSRMYFAHGATGASVRLLTHFVKNH